MKNYREIFNPTKITISGKSHILTTNEGKYVVKEKNKDIKSLYNYLNNRNFNKYPQIIDEYYDYDNKTMTIITPDNTFTFEWLLGNGE